MDGMTDQLMTGAWQQLADNLLSIRRSGGWRRPGVRSFEDYAARRWSLSKSRAALLCDFATFCGMCRRHMLPLPDSPDNIKPILELRKRDWADVWAMCVQHHAVNAKDYQALLAHLGIISRRKIPPSVLKTKKVRKAVETMAGLQDGEALVDEIGPDGLGPKWDDAVKVVIDADQERMNINGGPKRD